MPRTNSSLIDTTLAGLMKQRSNLDDAISALSELNGSGPQDVAKLVHKKRRHGWSKASRAKLSAAMKRHWEERGKKKAAGAGA